MPPSDSPQALREGLAAQRYLVDEGLATVAYLALRLRRPLLVEGEPGVGKTELAKALAGTLGVPLLRLQCYEGIDVHHALYDWDYPRQLLHCGRAARPRSTPRSSSCAGHCSRRSPPIRTIRPSS